MTDPGALSPREEAIVMLASGDLPATVAAVLETNATAVKAVGRAYGYPQSRTQIKAVAARLRSGDRDDLKHADALPGCPWTPPRADALDCDGGPLCPAVVHAPACNAAFELAAEGGPIPITYSSPEDDVPTTTPDVEPARSGVAQAMIDETAEFLEILEAAARICPEGSALLTAPLGRFVDPDGTETVLGLLHVRVEIDVAGALAFLGGDDQAQAVRWGVAREVTPEGAAAIRQLAALLEETPGGEVR